MSDDVSLAFSHPVERAKASTPEGVYDRLSLHDHIVSVEIGAFQAERDMLQRLSFDVVVEVSDPPDDLGDDVDLILSYDRIVWAIDTELAAERLNLLETLAERIADRILSEPQALRVFLRIQKLDKGNGKLGVEIVRVPGENRETQETSLAPTVAFFSNEALASPLLEGWADQLLSLDGPVVVCVDLPKSDTRLDALRAQLNIDLLQIEQVAWKLSARFPSFTVAGTRTEIEWGMKTGQPLIWAPGRLVLDATDSPIAAADSLAVWFAQQWNASRILCFGSSLPSTNTIPIQTVTLDQSAF